MGGSGLGRSLCGFVEDRAIFGVCHIRGCCLPFRFS
ncbi:hypothetical protein At12D1_40750 [Agrobacterium tumefaciens]|nr:hypothetical protein At12D1_40750 [Agrobacterium tumefaciens]